ncbi:hypothetical protein SAMN05444287_0913 [Octadecabacter temperatus]|uniref:Uncharacterized protein n=1 Tax=Octadecabacter temperatus TaxID=1458307 RepID=A0A0K0Y4D4_9RHOB|nr:hypothetical protein OSB_12590 [Octadecabacter temperatus]SIO01125.1 hypothetical protein SAMN05444287_0913 [Octadecabacter temperatus]
MAVANINTVIQKNIVIRFLFARQKSYILSSPANATAYLTTPRQTNNIKRIRLNNALIAYIRA